MISAPLSNAHLTLELPWPPSANVFLRHFLLRGRKHPSTCISEQGREFYAAVGRILWNAKPAKITGQLAVRIDLYPPNNRRIDVDNRVKPILDSLKRRPKDKKQKPGAWVFADDDSQVRRLLVTIHPSCPNARAIVTIYPLPGGEAQTELF